MKTFLSRALVLLVIAALVTPLTAGDSPATQAPVCCLTKGEHHCLGQVPGGAGSPAFSAVAARCPYAPLALAAMHGPALDGPLGAYSLAVNARQRSLGFDLRLATASSYVSTSSERGPPAFPLN